MASLLARMSLILIFTSVLFIGAALLVGSQLEAEIISATVADDNYNFSHFMLVEPNRMLYVQLNSPLENTIGSTLSFQTGYDSIILTQTIENNINHLTFYYYNLDNGRLEMLQEIWKPIVDITTTTFTISNLYFTDFPFAWSPEGKYVAVYKTDTHNLHVIELETFETVANVDIVINMDSESFYWLPDETTILIRQVGAISLFDVQTNELGYFPVNNAVSYDMSWSKDGKGVIINYRNEDQPTQLFNRHTMQYESYLDSHSAMWFEWCGEEYLALIKDYQITALIDLETHEQIPFPLPDEATLSVNTWAWHPEAKTWALILPVGGTSLMRPAYFYHCFTDEYSLFQEEMQIWTRTKDGFIYETPDPSGIRNLMYQAYVMDNGTTTTEQMSYIPADFDSIYEWEWQEWSEDMSNAIGLGHVVYRLFRYSVATGKVLYLTPADQIITQAYYWR